MGELHTDNEKLNIKKMIFGGGPLSKQAKKLARYVIVVKEKLLLIVSLYYSKAEDYKRVQREYEDLIR